MYMYNNSFTESYELYSVFLQVSEHKIIKVFGDILYSYLDRTTKTEKKLKKLNKYNITNVYYSNVCN